MKRPLSKQLGSALAHLQDLIDTIIHQKLFNSNSTKNSFIKIIKNIGQSYYKTYSKIKKTNST